MAVTELSRKAPVACPFCATLDRVDLGRLSDRPKCGHCGRPILLDQPVAVTDATVEAVFGVPATIRNWNTIVAIVRSLKGQETKRQAK